MKIVSLVENTSLCGLESEHGLSLHITLDSGRVLLFDMGQTDMYSRNADKLGIDLSSVDTAIISHGHYDHGGGLREFLRLNCRGKVYVRDGAFAEHYSVKETGIKYIGLDRGLSGSDRITTTGDKTDLSPGITLFSVSGKPFPTPPGNRRLLGRDRIEDDFLHEQNLVIEEDGKLVLFSGCSHCGVLNILDEAKKLKGRYPTHLFGGMHLMKNGLKQEEEAKYIGGLCDSLKERGLKQIFTMHCTGLEQFEMMKRELGELVLYMSCGEQVEI